MAAVWMVFRSEVRRRWRAWLALALLVGLFGAIVLAAVAGARRTDSAYPRLLGWSKAPNLLVFFNTANAATFAHTPPATLAGLPQVLQSATITFFIVAYPADVNLIAPDTTAVPASFWHRKILAGRLPDPGRADEVGISFPLAQSHHLKPGDMLRIRLLTADGKVKPQALRVVGIDAAPAEFPPQAGTGVHIAWATPAFHRQHKTGLDGGQGLAMRLRHGIGDLAAVDGELTRLSHGKVTQQYPLSEQAVNTQRSIHLQALAMWLLAGLLALIGVLITVQLLARLSFIESTDNATMRALGMGRGQLLAAGLDRAAAIGACGAAIAVTLAVAASPLLPVGLARIAEPHPGIDADGLVLILGAAGVVLATCACSAWPAWRAASRVSVTDTAPVRTSRPALSAAAARISSVPAAMGIRLAWQRGAGRTALPVRSTIAGAVVGIAALTAAVVFSASLGYLLATPRLYGVTWDEHVTTLSSGGDIAPAAAAAARDPRVAAWWMGYAGVPLRIRGVRIEALATGQNRGGMVTPVRLQGRLPERAGEITLGKQTLAAVHAAIGDTISASVTGSRPARLTIVGTAVFPTLDDALQLGTGAALTFAGLRAMVPADVATPPFDTLLVRTRPGAGSDTLGSELARSGSFAVQPPATPTDLVNFGRVQNLPMLFGAALSVLALATIAHLLITSVRRRRRDLAILRILGFTRGQVRRTVAWQAGALTGSALAIGIPLGIICGGTAWRLYADPLGIIPVVRMPDLLLAAMAPAALAVAVAVAALPGEAAARAQPAQVLRSE